MNIEHIPNLYQLYRIAKYAHTKQVEIWLKYYYSDSFFKYDTKEILELPIEDVENVFLKCTDENFIRIYYYVLCVHTVDIKEIFDSFNELQIESIYYINYI